MLSKVFLQTQFGIPHAWTQQYFDNVAKLAEYGWHWMIFTPNEYDNLSPNIHVVKMNVEEFDDLVKAKTGVRANNRLENGVPIKLVSDYYPAYGRIFEDYTVGYDYWGHTNWDMVYGRLDHYIPDEILANCDIWSDDVNQINGIFCLYKNNQYVNSLYEATPGWRMAFTQRQLFGFDEVMFTQTVRQAAAENLIRFSYPKYFAYHSYDRLIQHQPKPNLYMMKDGALIERYEDSYEGIQGHATFPKGHFGREIMTFHFINTKRWPL